MSCSSSSLNGSPSDAIGEIEISVDVTVARAHRHAEEMLHRGMVVRKSHRMWMGRQIVEAQRFREADDLAEQPAAVGQCGQSPCGFLVHAVGDECDSVSPSLVTTPNGAVASADEDGSRSR